MKFHLLVIYFLTLIGISRAATGSATANATDPDYPLHTVTAWTATSVPAGQEPDFTLNPPAAVDGSWQFFQVLISSTVSSSFGAYSKTSDPYLMDVQDLDPSNPSSASSFKKLTNSLSADYTAGRFPTEIYFLKQSGTMTLHFKNFGSGASNIKVRGFFLKKPAGQIAEIGGARIYPAFGDITQSPDYQIDEGTWPVIAGQDIKLKIGAPGATTATYDEVQIFDNASMVGKGEWEGALSAWTLKLNNLEKGLHVFKAYFRKDHQYIGWSKALAIDADWLSLNVVFSAGRGSYGYGSNNYEGKYLISDGGVPFGLVANSQLGVFDYPLEGDWKFGWLIDEDEVNTPVSSQVNRQLLFNTYCRMKSPSGSPLKWEATVPNGTYQVTINAGDATTGPESYSMLVEGKRLDFVTAKMADYLYASPQWIGPGWHDKRTVIVDVTDGRLTLEPLDADQAPKLNILTIEQLSSGQHVYAKDFTSFHRYSDSSYLSVSGLSGQEGIMARSGSNPWGVAFSTSPVLYAQLGDVTSWVDSNLEPMPSGPLYFDMDPGSGVTQAKWGYQSSQPFVYFGSRFGAKPLSTKQSYSYALDTGIIERNANIIQMRLRVFDKTSGAYVSTLDMNLDRLANWTTFDASQPREGLTQNFDFPAYSLKAKVSLSEDMTYQSDKTKWVFTHQGGDPRYVYLFESFSQYRVGNFVAPIAQPSGAPLTDSGTYTMLFAFSVDETPEITVDTLSSHFEGKPKPVTYYGTSLDELQKRSVTALDSVMTMKYGTPAQDVLDTNWQSTAALWADVKSVDESPELRSHTLLDEFVDKMKSDPIALANYVQNEIGLSDAVGYNQGYAGEAVSIDPAGVQRGALGCFLEGQGSPHEQCALLVYLLRKAGYPAVYVTTGRNRLLMESSVASKMLMTQFKELPDVPDLIAMNYPWVAVQIVDAGGNKKWRHLFPWIKDINIQEGVDLYSALPPNYNTSWKWVWDYFQGNEDVLPFQLRSLAGNPSNTSDGVLFKKTEVFDESLHDGKFPSEYEGLRTLKDYDQPYQLFPRFVKWKLREQQSGFAYSDLGLKKQIRPHYSSRWEDFPKPTVVGGTLRALRGLNETPRIFDTIQYEVVKVTNGTQTTVINTGDQLLCDMHNRKVYVERWDFLTPGTNQVGLVMSPFDPLENNAMFAAGFKPYNTYPNWTGVVNVDQGDQDQSIALGRFGRVGVAADDGVSDYQMKITHKRQRNNASRSLQAGNPASDYGSAQGLSSIYSFSQFQLNVSIPGLEYEDMRPIRKGLFGVCINSGRVTQAMLEAHVRHLWKYEAQANQVADSSMGTRTYLMGMSYWEYMSRFKDEIGALHKVSVQGDYGHLFAGLKYESGAGIPSVPSIDIYRVNTLATIYNGALNPIRQENRADIFQDYFNLLGCQGSAYEHGVMERYYGNVGAISTMRTFHLAKAARESARAVGNTAEVAANELLVINSQNYTTQSQSIIRHQIEGSTDSSIASDPNLTEFNTTIGSYATASTPGLSLGAYNLLVMAPKYYKYYDNKALALECAGIAPIPTGIMGGYIAPLSKTRRYGVRADITPRIPTGSTPAVWCYGHFTAPNTLAENQDQTILFTVGAGESPQIQVAGSTEGAGPVKTFSKWKIYKNSTGDTDPSNDQLLAESTAGINGMTITSTLGTLTFPTGGGGHLDVPVAENSANYQVRIEALFKDPITFSTTLREEDGFNGGAPYPKRYQYVDLVVSNVFSTAATPATIVYKWRRTENGSTGAWSSPQATANPALAWTRQTIAYHDKGTANGDKRDELEIMIKRAGCPVRYFRATGNGAALSATTTEESGPFSWTYTWPANY